MNRKVVLVGVDIEKTGDSLRDLIISIGLVVGNEEGDIYDKKRFNFEVDWFDLEKKTYGDFEMRCVDEFWSKQPQSMIDECKVDAREQQEGWKIFRGYINGLEEKYNPKDYSVKFLSDNPSFDIAGIDYWLEAYGYPILRRPVGDYPWPLNYRSVVASDDMLYLMSDVQLQETMKHINLIVKHDHNPVNDAHVIYLYYTEAYRMRKAMYG